MFFEIFSSLQVPFTGTLHSKFFQKMLILPFEANSALSCQNGPFFCFLAHYVHAFFSGPDSFKNLLVGNLNSIYLESRGIRLAEMHLSHTISVIIGYEYITDSIFVKVEGYMYIYIISSTPFALDFCCILQFSKKGF